MAFPLSYYGGSEGRAEYTVLRAGPWRMLLEGGSLRDVRLGGVEVIRRVYAAVRDRNWGTVPGVISEPQVQQDDSGFLVRFRMDHRENDIDFAWHGTIEGNGNGLLRFDFDGEARSEFLRNRIGICVLHPPESVMGRSCIVSHADGCGEESVFPTMVSDVNPFQNVAGLTYEPLPGTRLSFIFEGDLFETEDQRNWIDGSFKTFCTPLQLPYPHQVRPGDRVRQSVTLRVEGTIPASPAEPSGPVSLVIGEEAVGQLPQLGLACASHGEPLGAAEAAALRALKLAHLRAEVDLTSDNWRERWRQAAQEARRLDCRLEVQLWLPSKPEEALSALVGEARQDAALVARWLVFTKGRWTTDPMRFEDASIALREAFPEAAVWSGSAANFCELNRDRGVLQLPQGLVFGACPQEHATDVPNFLEALDGLDSVLRSAKELADSRPVGLSPVTLRKRVNPYATAPDPPVPLGALSRNIDPRQMSLFAAAWTLGVLARCVRNGVDSVTLYETTGWLGVMERESGSALPELFPSAAGQKFPVYHLLAFLSERRGARVLAASSSGPQSVETLALQSGEDTDLLLANYEEQPISIALPADSNVKAFRMLDEHTWSSGFRAAVAGQPYITLPPLAIGVVSLEAPVRKEEPILAARGIQKRFGGVHALRGVDFEAYPGEIHTLMGENGAGKSTLMHILGGVYRPDAGELFWRGQPLQMSSNLDAQRAGIAIVFQERSLFGSLSIAENIFAARQPVGASGRIDRAQLRRDTAALIGRVGLAADPDMPVEMLSSAQQQLVEIAKALSQEPRLIVFDEPTAALTASETERLFAVIRSLRAAGVAIVFISHRMEEVFALSDRVTVLKDGRSQGTFPIGEATPDSLVSLMVGREVELHARRESGGEPGPVVLEGRNLCDDRLNDISFHVRAGEIVGFAGLVGAGRTELALLLIGQRPRRAGAVLLEGREVRFRHPAEAVAAGVAYLPEDRQDGGLFLSMAITENIAAAGAARFGRWRYERKALEAEADKLCDQLSIRCASLEQPVEELSGGNQQKVALAKWLLTQPKVLIVDEPTRGVDVAAKAAIHQVLCRLADQGMAVMVISSDLPEILAVSDRIYVMAEGMIAGELRGAEATEEQVVALASQSRATLTREARV